MAKRESNIRGGNVHIGNAVVGGSLNVTATSSVTVENISAGGDIRVQVTSETRTGRVQVTSETRSGHVETTVEQNLMMKTLVDEVSANPRPVDSTNFFQRSFHRDSDNGMISGVCQGLADDLHINPIWLRAAFITLAFFGVGTGIALYLIALVLLPNQPRKVPELPGATDDMPPELREAWREVEEITKN